MENIEKDLHVQQTDFNLHPSEVEASEYLGSCKEQFDASQYDFFGTELSHEVLEELEDGQLPLEEGVDTLGEEVADLEVVSELDYASDFESSFSKKLLLQSDERAGFLDDLDNQRSFVGREYHPPPSQSQETSLNWAEYAKYGIQADKDRQNVQSYNQELEMQGLESRSFQRPYFPQQQRWLGAEFKFSQAGQSPYPMARPQTMPSQGPGKVISPVTPAVQGPLSSSYRSHLFPQNQSHTGAALPPYVNFRGGISNYPNPAHVNVPSQQGQWLPFSGIRPIAPVSLVPNLMQQQIPPQNALLPSQVMLRGPGVSSPYAHSQHLYGPAASVSPLVPRGNDNFFPGDFREQRNGSEQQSRHPQHHYQSSSDAHNISNRSNGRRQFRSKYMTAEEIESILRIQLAATHSNDPYVDDYYHQAVQAKIGGGRRHFAPTRLRDLNSHARAAAEPHAFLEIDALGRIPFSSIRRPRPLLEVDTGTSISGGTNKGINDIKSSERPLEEEPMLAARIAIEDGLGLLLDIDDIDRLLSANPTPDAGAQLRRRRQYLLESLAASLQLVDPLTHTASTSGIYPTSGDGSGGSKDDLVFLRLASLSKGRKFLVRYLQLLPLGSEIARIVCMGIFRHLRFFFGSIQADESAVASTLGLVKIVVECVTNMDLNALSTCVASVAFSPEQPPLRPVGSVSGDGATLILRSVLDRATKLLTDPSRSYTLQNRDLWQASFNAFFALLSRYCTDKYESIIHSLMISSPGNITAINSAAALAMSKEMPVDLLRASLPHTNELQRRQLLEFAKRSMVMGGLSSQTNNDGVASTPAVLG